MKKFNIYEDPHRRFNPLINEWVLVSPHRAKRPWQGQKETLANDERPEYDSTCYLCPGNVRANGEENAKYKSSFVFENDFAALKKEEIDFEVSNEATFFKVKPERGISKVVCFSPKHNITLPEMDLPTIEEIIRTWQREYTDLGNVDYINYFANLKLLIDDKYICDAPRDFWPNDVIWAQDHKTEIGDQTQISSI